MPDDVADDHRDPVLVDRQQVVPVAARGDADGAGQVAGGDPEPGQRRQRRGEQAALQDVRHVVLGLVQPRPVQRLGALPGQRQHRGALLRGEGRPPVGEPQHDRAGGPGRAAERERHGDERAGVRPAAVPPAALPQGLAGAGRVRRGVTGVQRQPAGRRRDRARAAGGQHVEVLPGAQQDRGGARAQPHGVVQDDLGDVDEPGRAGQRPDDLAELLGRPPCGALRGEQPGALQRLRAQLRQHRQRGAGGAGAHVARLPAEPDDADARAGGDQRDAVDRAGIAVLGPHRAAGAGRLGGGVPARRPRSACREPRPGARRARAPRPRRHPSAATA